MRPRRHAASIGSHHHKVVEPVGSNGAPTTRLLAKPAPASTFNTASIAEESCRIVGMAAFYPDRKVDMPYIEQFTPVMEGRLVTAGARLAAVLNRVFR